MTLIRALLSRKLDAEEMRLWYRYLDWLLPLTPERRAESHRQLDLLDQEGKMPFVSDLEQRAEERAEAKIKAKLEHMERLVDQTRDLAAQERDRAAQERDRAAHALRENIVQCARLKFGSAEGLGEALAGKPLDALEAVSKDIWDVPGLAELLARIP